MSSMVRSWTNAEILPEQNQTVLLYCPNRPYKHCSVIILGYYHQFGYWVSSDCGEDEDLFPTHWMPLPGKP